MCKTLPVLLVIGNSLKFLHSSSAVKYHPKSGLRSSWPVVAGANFSSFGTCRSVLVHRGGLQQIDLLPFSFNDSGADLGGGLAFFVFLVGVVEFLQAGRALRPMRAFKAAMQAVVAHAVAIAVARLLVEHVRDLRCQLIGVPLVGVLGVRAPQVRLGQDGRQLRAFRWRSSVVGWDASFVRQRAPFG